ncbi:MAG: glycosyltransferase family 4 protein [Thiobacillus sp.]|nr:glycosyltransferase family 4 protein [Thiobacillus sp.]
MNPVINAVIVSNAPAPYRVPGWRRVAEAEDIHLDVIYCTQPHIDTTLDAAAHGFSTHFLTGRYKAMDRRFMHSDLGIWSLLNQLRPDVVITTGFIPTYLFAFAWAVMHGVPHVAMTDGTAQSEKSLSWLHRFVRRIVFARSAAFVGACEGSRDLYREYGVPDDRIHTSQLCADNDRFSRPGSATPVDFIFCGRFMESKRPLFAMQVAREVAVRLGRRTSIDFVGSGEMEPEMRDYAAQISDFVDVRFHGYATQAELPSRYADARIFLFPTEADVWGVVANEACAVGLPVIVSPHAGVAGELVLDGSNGYVRELDVAQWAEAAVSLLTDEARYSRFSQSSRERVAEYTFEHAARGLLDAIRQAHPARKVCIVQAVAKQYRRPFFDLLHARLQAEGVALTVIYSAANKLEAERKDAVDLPIAYGHKVHAYWSRDFRMLYQPCLGRVMAADLVIVEQASKHVLNYILGAMRAFGLVRMAYWGHGRNWQQDGSRWLEPVKHALLGKSDWWFAYTNRVARYVVDSGFPADRVTVVQNSIDVNAFGKAVESIEADQRLALRHSLGISPEAPIGLFCGSMHPSKKLGFLVEAAIQVHARVPDFHLVLVGAGPDEHIARKAATEHDWIHYTGPLFSTDKAAHFAIADLFMCPGLVGLAVLEAFAAGLPLFTTNIPVHSPEIDYLTDSVTGAITDFDPRKYGEAVSACLHDPASLARMSEAARDASRCYGLEPMVENFAQGVLACLNQS